MIESLTQGDIKTSLCYDHETGVFTWRRSASNGCVSIGTVAGHRSACDNYIRIRLEKRKPHLAHRLAWLYMTGEWPDGDIDHINGDRSDNRWANLRVATRSNNLANQGVARHNTTGFKGVTKHRTQYAAQINVMGKHINLGVRKTPEEAAALYREAALKHFGEFARWE